ncbi:MAG TPA: glycosyltransferase family 39 protein [Anaerolineaceae bacterium]|nr:glycosyltransferase family 39 protein [Anaerolineaceae bacterium]
MTKQNRFTDLLPFLIAIIFLVIYLVQAVQFVKTIEPVMDEGTYLLKGKWYWEGTYQPFEEHGPITNKPPLAFYTLGLSQILFEPGLLSGRYFAVFLSVLLLIGQWLTVRRLAGNWWASFSIALYAISPAWIIYYSRAMTQVVTSLCIVWSLYFFLGRGRTQLQLTLGAALAAMTVMVRQNMLPLFILTLLYILWENGWRKSMVPAISSLLLFIGMNALYWPATYQFIWQPVFPSFLNKFIAGILHFDLLTGDIGKPFLIRKYHLAYETQVFFDGVRYFFLPFITSIFSLVVLFPRKVFSETEHRKSVYLAINFILLTILHYAYALYENNVLYSFPAYFAFYLPIGVTLIPLIYKDFLKMSSKTRNWLVSIITIATTTGIGLSLYRDISSFFMNWNLPSISQRTLSGPYELWDVLLNRFGISIHLQEFIIPTIVGFLAGLLLWVITIAMRSLFHKKLGNFSFGSVLMLVVLTLGCLFSPTFILAAKGSIATYPSTDIPARYNEAADQMKSIIPENALVYWDGYTPILFLYLPEIRTFPAQLNMEFYYRIGGNTAIIEKQGFWDEELATRWITEADLLVFSEETYQKRFAVLDASIQSNFRELPGSINPDPYQEGNAAIILERITTK